MFIFAEDNNRRAENRAEKIIIPASRLIDICTCGCSVIINYLCLDKIESCRVIFDSADNVSNAIRQFYMACKNKVDAFYFGENGGNETNE
jgi:hypothetical protein